MAETAETILPQGVDRVDVGKLDKDRAIPLDAEAAGDSYDEEEDDDYDPTAKHEDEVDVNSDAEDDGELQEAGTSSHDYSKIQLTTSQVRTRRQRQELEALQQSRFIGTFETDHKGLVRAPQTEIDIDSLFSDLKSGKLALTPQRVDAKAAVTPQREVAIEQLEPANPTVTILTSYSFAGKLVTKTKIVDANSAEARAYMNSTSSISTADTRPQENRSHVIVMRKIQGTDTEVPLRIKLKRPSIVDKFLGSVGSKLQKLSTLEKSRLDWASFVDDSRIKDDLAIHNRGGYLEKQSFLDRIQSKRDAEFKRAQAADKQQQRLLEKS